ncbi:hypothetical protein SNE40_004831 [Patella caerulea]|uniref:NADH dehydrogenase [ubiquinone] 1 beta subcomplex subunit 6 n=1 Tax=Patella caerulea TaxID=87958 RepID=A0AAN8K6A2_PATCE
MGDQVPFDNLGEREWQKQLRLQKEAGYRGSRYPRFSIEPVPYERNRLAGAGMTDEVRALRRQWVKDQLLSPNEPVHVPALQQKNIFRRTLAKPWDIIFRAVKPFLGDHLTARGRSIIPKIAACIGVGYVAWYQLKYHHNDWTKADGWYLYYGKPIIVRGREPIPQKQDDDFCDRDFKSRTALHNVKTSSME